MSPLRHLVPTIIKAFVLAHLAAHLCAAQQPTFTPYRAGDIYAVGEKVGWTAALLPGAAPAAGYTYTVRKNNQDVIKTGTLDFSSGRATIPNIEVTLDEPAMVYVQISNPGDAGPTSGTGMALGAAVAPEKLQPSVARPADFDAFWASKIKTLKAVPENALLTPADSGKPDVEYATIRM